MLKKPILALVSFSVFLFYPEFLVFNHDQLVLSDLVPHNNSNLDHNGEGDHDHFMIMISHGKPIPQVNLIVHEDAISGWNLELQLTNFKFTPEKVNLDGGYQEGHGHLYINGKKVTRIYSNWYYLPQLEPGRNEIKVTLNTNKHDFLMSDGKMIEVIKVITVN